MEENLKKIIGKMSENEKMELASGILKKINEKSSKNNFDKNSFFAEGLTDEMEW